MLNFYLILICMVILCFGFNELSFLFVYFSSDIVATVKPAKRAMRNFTSSVSITFCFRAYVCIHSTNQLDFQVCF